MLVDDGSTDDSVKILKEYARRYDWIRFFPHKENRGVQTVLAESLPLLKGDYIYFGSSDDWVRPGFFAEAMEWARRYPKAGLIFGQIVAVTPAGRQLYVVEVSKWKSARFASPEEYRRECLEAEVAGQSFGGSTIFRKSALVAGGGFRSELGSWCDSFAARVVGLYWGVCYVPKPFMTWVLSPDSLSHSMARRPRAMLKIINRAAYLMRSDEFRDIFPDQHVRRWRRGYRLIVIEQYVLSWFSQKLVRGLAQSKRWRRWRRRWWNLLSG